MRIGIGRRAVGVTGMAEQIGGSPQQLDACGFLQLGCLCHYFIKILAGFGKIFAFRRDIPVMETVIRRTQFGGEFKRGIQRLFGCFHRFAAGQPRTAESPGAENVRTGSFERVPVGNGEAQMFPHGLAADFFVSVIKFKRQRIARFRTFVLDGLFHFRKICFHFYLQV